jgi:hypothetical protein
MKIGAFRRRLGAIVRRLLHAAPDGPREQLARQFLCGNGIEIGALHQPLWTPPGAAVKYVDRLDVRGLRRHYPELEALPLVPVDVVDDGETLKAFPPESRDFIIANHFLEHTQDPIGTIRRFLEVLRPRGVLYMAVPDKRWTFDRLRPVTPLEHLYRDHEEGPAWSYHGHVCEFAELAGGCRGAELESAIQTIKATNYSIHFHVWTQHALLEMLIDVRRRLVLPFDIEAVRLHQARAETIVILRRQAVEDLAA